MGVQYMWEAANQAGTRTGAARPLLLEGHPGPEGPGSGRDPDAGGRQPRLPTGPDGVGRDAVAGHGEPAGLHEEAYHWLHGAVIGDKAIHQKAASLLSWLGNRMPANAIARAKAMR